MIWTRVTCQNTDLFFFFNRFILFFLINFFRFKLVTQNTGLLRHACHAYLAKGVECSGIATRKFPCGLGGRRKCMFLCYVGMTCQKHSTAIICFPLCRRLALILNSSMVSYLSMVPFRGVALGKTLPSLGPQGPVN